MQVFKHFMKAAYKNIFSILIYAVIFLVVIFSVTSDKKETAYREESIDVIIDDRAHDQVSEAVERYFQNDKITYKNMTDSDKELAISLAESSLIVTINEDAEKLILEDPKAAVSVYSVNDESGAGAVYNLSQFIGFLKYYELDTDKAMDMMNTSADVIIMSGEKAEVDLNYLFRFAAFILTAMLMFNISLVNSSLNEKNFYKRTVASPIKNLSYNAQIFLGQGILALVLIVFMLFVMSLILPEIKENIGMTFLNFLVYILSILGMANLLTSITDKKQAVVAIVNVFSMLLATTGGAFIPLEFLPNWMVNVGKIMPFYYFGANANVYTIDQTYIRNLLIMLLMGVFYFVLSSLLLKKKRSIE